MSERHHGHGRPECSQGPTKDGRGAIGWMRRAASRGPAPRRPGPPGGNGDCPFQHRSRHRPRHHRPQRWWYATSRGDAPPVLVPRREGAREEVPCAHRSLGLSMRGRDQLIGATVLGIATWFGILRIAEAKNEAAVGSATYAVDERHHEDFAAFTQVLTDLRAMNQDPLAARLDELHRDTRIWVAPHLGPQRWAVFVETMSLVRRIYIR